ncbi:MAG: SH3 domain-containing protein [Oscillospiraceae bacterium]|nr:SH3 domain-containing protein [Oscillospiraceae bacterium]
MKKRLICLLLAVVLLMSVALPTVMAEEVLAISQEALDILKLEEGFSKTPYWDYAQWTVGYGTKCPDDKLEEYRQNGISEEDAEQLLRTYIAKFESELHAFMIRTGVWLDQKQFDALMLFSYNCGTGWSYDTTGVLYNAIVGKATGSDLVNAFARWCNAGGEVKTFLLRRRLCEVNIYLNGEYSQTASEKYGYVIYDANGGAVKPGVQGFVIEEKVAPAVTPTLEGRKFLGWFTDKTGGTEVKVLDASVRNVRLYARWDQSGTAEQKPAEEQKGVTVTVTANGVNVRSGPGTSYSVKKTVSTGAQLVITATKQDSQYLWGQFDGGWICLQYTNYDLQTKPETETKPEENKTRMGTVKVNDQLRVRKGPSTGYEVVDYLKNGARVEILEEKMVGSVVWGRIAKGWISLDYVVLDPVADTKPAEPTPTEPTPTEPKPTEPAPTEPKPTEPAPTEPKPTEPKPTEPTPPSESEEDTAGVWTGTVKVNDRLNVRKGPSTSNPIVGYLKKGERVTITEMTVSGSMTWGKISNGWISMDYIVLDSGSTSATQKTTGTVKVNDFLRVRSGPGTSYAIAAYLKKGDKVEITERKTVGGTQWGKIDKGWISLDYIVFDQGSTQQNQQTQTTQKVTKTVTADCLRIRSAAGTNNSIVGYLYRGAKVEILETKTVGGTTWGRVSKGWISMDYVK